MSLRLVDLLSLTYHSLCSNTLRSALTTLGVFMGVAAVSATSQVRNISQAMIAQQLAAKNAPRITLAPEWQPRHERIRLKLEDIEFLRQRLPGLQAISALNGDGFVSTLFRDVEANPFLEGVSQDFLLTQGRPLIAGRFFTIADFENYRPVAVIDKFLADRLFKGENPVGQRIYSNRRPYIVVGVLAATISLDEQPKGQVLIPLSTYGALTGKLDIAAIQVRPTELKDLEDMEQQAKELLEQRFPDQKFWHYNNVDDILQQQKTLDLAAQALSVVAVISLLVGGVGIANVMIASVTERTPEIGLRRAIGATKGDVMVQFVLESAILSLIGGVVALGMVHGLTLVIAHKFKLPYQFEADTAAIALSSALLVGVGAGFPPALVASKLDPVVALRSK